MSSAISSVGSTAQSYGLNAQSNRSKWRQDFQSLADALKNNDLQGAQTAFAALQTDSPRFGQLSQGKSTTATGNPAAADLQNLTQALSQGDLSSAQTAFAQLLQDLQAIGAGRHHHQGAATNPVSSALSNLNGSSATDSDGDNDGSTPSVNVQA